MHTGIHVVLGAGQIGSSLAALLRAQGHRVRVVRRSGASSEHVLTGDLADLRFAEAAMQGAEVVYQCVNVSYDQWASVLPRITAGVLHGAARAGAKLVVLDNLYMLDPTDGPLRPDSAIKPRSRKGAVRAELAARYLGAHEAGQVRVAIGRASDFFGPRVTSSALFGERFFKRLASGQSVEVLGDCDLPHSFSYVPDVVSGLAVLGANERSLGQVWHLPVAKAESPRQMMARFGLAAQRTLQVSPVPVLMLRAMGLFSPIIRELIELTYQWQSPWVVDDSKFRAAFGLEATPLDLAVAATMHWARERSRLAA